MSLCDNLNLIGTARYNNKLRMVNKQFEDTDPITSLWANQPDSFNHSELMHIQALATDAGIQEELFPWLRPLPQDNGERFFGLYWIAEKERQKKHGSNPLNDRCCCPLCGKNPVEIDFRKKHVGGDNIEQGVSVARRQNLPSVVDPDTVLKRKA